MARDDGSSGAPPCDDRVAGPLGNARESLRELLTTEAETLVVVLGWIEVAMECSLERNQRQSVRRHCREALKLISAIEGRHPDGDLPKPVARVVTRVRKEVTRAIDRIDDS